MAFDGANIWVEQLGGTVTKLRASDGAIGRNLAVAGSQWNCF